MSKRSVYLRTHDALRAHSRVGYLASEAICLIVGVTWGIVRFPYWKRQYNVATARLFWKCWYWPGYVDARDWGQPRPYER